MISFENDYSTGAHPRILEALAATNLEPTPGYGGDRFCESAVAHIRAACDDETADVFFLTEAPRPTPWSFRRCWPGTRA